MQKGDVVEVPGFEKALEAWRSGKWPNHGFLLLLNGGALQVTLASREAAGEGPKEVALGGAESQRATVIFDPLLVRQIVPKKENLESAALRVRLLDKKEALGSATLTVAAADKTPLGAVPLSSADKDGWLSISGLASVITGDSNVQLTLTVLNAPKPVRLASTAIERDTPKLAVMLRPSVPPAAL